MVRRRRGSGLGGGWLCRVPLSWYCWPRLRGADERRPSSAVTSNFDGSIAAVLRDEFSVDCPPRPTPWRTCCARASVLFWVTFCLFSRCARAWPGRLAGLSENRSLAARAVRLCCGRGRVWRAVSGTLGRMWRALTAIDLRDPAEKTLLRLLAVNFAIVTFICCFWFLGIAGTVIYTVVLFFLLRRRANRIQQDYAALLAAARRMAGGDLATPVEGDMGLFDPLKDELNQVRAGFEKAVAAEVRSQNMKTELITNVSHDLKTPLTAIITYVDLLKDPALSAEDRAKYIETLDKKSQRLKRLIEDLFEVSKAATRNVAHYAEVDLAALLKQVQYELADKTEASGIDFRWRSRRNACLWCWTGKRPAASLRTWW
ncbi:MAG: sensor histidine kinase [Ruthenibacterium lactatiformans]